MGFCGKVASLVVRSPFSFDRHFGRYPPSLCWVAAVSRRRSVVCVRRWLPLAELDPGRGRSAWERLVCRPCSRLKSRRELAPHAADPPESGAHYSSCCSADRWNMNGWKTCRAAENAATKWRLAWGEYLAVNPPGGIQATRIPTKDIEVNCEVWFG